MTLIDRVRDRLADTMVAEDRHGQVVAGQKVELLLTVVGFTDSALNFEMIRAAGQLQTLIAPFRRLLSELLQRPVQPRQCEQYHRPSHSSSFW